MLFIKFTFAIGQRVKALNKQVPDETHGPVKNEWNQGGNFLAKKCMLPAD
jgi:hypothetical protein